MTTKTLHGCTCLKDWVKMDGKKYSGCVYGNVMGSGSQGCLLTTDKEKLDTPKCGSRADRPTLWVSRCPVEPECGWGQISTGKVKKSLARNNRKQVLKDSFFWDICEPEISGQFGRPNYPSKFFKMSRGILL